MTPETVTVRIAVAVNETRSMALIITASCPELYALKCVETFVGSPGFIVTATLPVPTTVEVERPHAD